MNDVQIRFLKNKRLRQVIWWLSILALILYPLRHVSVGVDLWDGGYNYANFRYSGLKYMDSMWYFATWLANAAGSMLMRLPFGNTMLGMNVYTGLIVSIMATVSYFFCVKKLRISAPVAFVGELTAIALCWAPTSALYNYLTYLFLLVAICFLYQGLVIGKYSWLVAAGVVLGLNVGNRFSNLVQAGLILAVWVYGFWDRKKLVRVLKETGFCVLGYVASLGVFLLGISLRYGFGSYVESVLRLFRMTEHAQDYAPGYMLLRMAMTFCESKNTYWAKRFLLLFGLTLTVCLPVRRLWHFVIFRKKNGSTGTISAGKALVRIRQGICVIFTAAVIFWLGYANFSYPDYAVYESIYAPCVILFELLTILTVCCIFDGNASKEDRLFALLMLLTVFLTSLGGNNAMYASINNTFLVMPGFLWMCYRFCRERKELLAFPVKCVLFVSVLFVLVPSMGFGRTFVYEGATGGRGMDREISGIPVLEGMRTDEGKAESLEGLYQYLSAKGLKERECILYGQIPGISYYMDLAPALNIWSDLLSYGLEIMEEDLGKVEGELAEDSYPILILERKHADYMLTEGESEVQFYDDFAEQKLWLLADFMEKHGYEITYYNEGFAVFETR